MRDLRNLSDSELLSAAVRFLLERDRGQWGSPAGDFLREWERREGDTAPRQKSLVS